MFRQTRSVVAAAVFFALPICCAIGQNLLSNGRFDTSASGWAASDPAHSSVAWNSLDSGGSSASGSLQVLDSADFPTAQAAHQCVTVAPGQFYDLAGKSRIPSGQTAGGGAASVYVYWHNAAGCPGQDNGMIGLGLSATSLATDVWNGGSMRVQAPAAAVSADILLMVSKGTTTGTLYSLFDDVVFAPADSYRTTRTIPVAASIHGVPPTFFHSDLFLLNRSFVSNLPVTATYRCFGGSGCGSPQTITLAPRESRLVSDIVGTLFQAPETGGAIELAYNTFDGALSAQTRLYTPVAQPTYGFGVPALDPSQATSRAVFVGVAGNPVLTSGFRSNAGVYNPNSTTVTVTMQLFAGSGLPIGAPFVRATAPFDAFQVTNVIATIGDPSLETRGAVLVVTSEGGSVFPYLSVVDNVSGDAFWVSASADEPPVP